MRRPSPRPVEEVASPLFLRVVGVFDLEPSDAQVIRIAEPLCDDSFEIVRADQLEELLTVRGS
jgi:hypothetical protein